MAERRISRMDEDEDHVVSGGEESAQGVVRSIVPRSLPSETMFMLMLIRLEARVNALEERLP